MDAGHSVENGQLPPARRGGPKPRLSTALIADTVLEIGFDQASMSAVARVLDCSHGALYRHVGDLDGMMHLALVRATARYEWPALVDDWQEVVWNEARAWWAFCEQYPGFATTLAKTFGMPSPMSRRGLAVAVHLNQLGLSTTDALLMVDLVMDMVHDIFHRSAQRAAVIDRALTMPPEDVAEHIASVSLEMLETLADALVDDPWPWFTRKLKLMMNGVGPVNPPPLPS